jgi:hypothetical protein
MICVGKRRLGRFGCDARRLAARDGRTLCLRSCRVPGWGLAGDRSCQLRGLDGYRGWRHDRREGQAGRQGCGAGSLAWVR